MDWTNLIISNLKFKKFNEYARIPFNLRPTPDGDAGYDLYAAEMIIMQPKDRKKITTGLGIALPSSIEAQIRPRSGLTDSALDVLIGTIDPSYRGEIKVQMVNNSDRAYLIEPGMRIAQMVIKPFVSIANWDEVDELPPSSRGTRGFGSSGIKEGDRKEEII